MPDVQSMNAAMATVFVYIAKEEGRYEMAAWNMPALDTRISIKYKATRWFMALLMTLYALLSHIAQT